MDEDTLAQLENKINSISERLSAIEKEQRLIRQDILSGNPKENMQRRLLNGTPERTYHQKKEKIDSEIKIEI